ncbi:hypothetical protein KWH77_19760 [Enterobacter sichuanensis]|uniref:hypothetical protein n=1 Tax=Enterobacter sichuanensis TaxID=2071710 RepID=UPI0021CEF133|nr:hypothetical protein [Enterobacter sichuanensis]MCU6428447.1 hypothetical protein [Enterobacter sichuanensis]
MKIFPVCENIRTINDHLNELALFCIFIENKKWYTHKDETIEICTSKIGEWLKLSADLEKTIIANGGFYSDSVFYCEPAIGFYDDHAKLYSFLSTILTKFIYSLQAFDNMQKFVNGSSSTRYKKMKSYAVRCEKMIDSVPNDNIPLHFEHYANNLNVKYHRYIKRTNSKLNNTLSLDGNSIGYSHCILRNIRNVVSHGSFPLYYGTSYMDKALAGELVDLLIASIRMICLYIQTAMLNFCDKMESSLYDEYLESAEENPQDDKSSYFITKFNINLAKDLHYKNKYNINDFIC